MTDTIDEARFRGIFSHLGEVTAYAARRGSRDPDGVAAEVMTIAWRRLAVVPADDPRPWLYGTARNVVYAEARSRRRTTPADVATAPAPEVQSLDPELDAALRNLRSSDREALLLVAWEDLTPTDAAAALGITATAFRVRLFRARRRLQAALATTQPAPLTTLDVEGT
ncbi:MAG TPA: sigma-70 family RNA polymerase sigma factor [Gaiellaceae bacterium]|jgi:RNA polymerase sigma-70 factor (ECF subfamily)